MAEMSCHLEKNIIEMWNSFISNNLSIVTTVSSESALPMTSQPGLNVNDRFSAVEG